MTTLTTVTIGTDDVTGWIIAAAALVAAAVILGRPTRQALRMLHGIKRVLDRELATGETDDEPLKTTVVRELTNNHGSSLKDDVDGIARGLRLLGAQVDDLDARLTTHLAERTPQP